MGILLGVVKKRFPDAYESFSNHNLVRSKLWLFNQGFPSVLSGPSVIVQVEFKVVSFGQIKEAEMVSGIQTTTDDFDPYECAKTINIV